MADPSTQQIQDTTQDTNPSQDTDTPGSDAATTAASSPANVSGSKRKPPVPKSSVWDHFVKLPLEETNGEPRAKCKYCKDHTYACDTSKHGTTSLKKHLLKCKGGDTIGKAIEKCLLGWGIEKVFSITVDNASSNDTAVAYLKKRLKNWNGWNSTYLMLEHALKFQKVFDRMEDEDDGYNAYFRDDSHRLGPPMTFDWTSAVHQDPLIGEMTKKMKLKYDKYWGRPENMNPLLVIGVVLDPRYKFGYVNNTFNDIYDNDPILCESMKKKVIDTLYLLYDKYSVGVVGEQSEHEEESGDSGAVNHPGDLPMPDFVTANPNPKGKWWSGRTKHPSDQKTDLDKYLETDAIDDAPSFDVLTWWRENATKYKVVSLIARDVLAMAVSTVASESAFSTGGRVLDVFRSSLSLKLTEALICTQNWLSPTEFNFNDPDFDQYEETDSIASDVSGESTVTEDVNMS
ncbi:zinc finger BED domain-containing protein RICESLEEPER 2-like [Senna tora]|uniref:Zinc finger BED domain-containing protein RICESLEEPER 2-like n=1 Tax=Senna tora TaxID=362788 RepID=A0A834XFF6_9FABA|nr:zinc finger BED domain-containing protein RICESLEEPER 2-like [Senna tora]